MRQSLVGILGILMYGALKWAFDHFLWDWLTQYLDVRWHLREATLITSFSSYVIPLLVVLFCIVAIYRLARHGDTKSPDEFQLRPDMKISDAIDYIVNDSTANLEKPARPESLGSYREAP